jgi:hypothetical protein
LIELPPRRQRFAQLLAQCIDKRVWAG